MASFDSWRGTDGAVSSKPGKSSEAVVALSRKVTLIDPPLGIDDNPGAGF
jgi:hypothetical protein